MANPEVGHQLREGQDRDRRTMRKAPVVHEAHARQFAPLGSDPALADEEGHKGVGSLSLERRNSPSSLFLTGPRACPLRATPATFTISLGLAAACPI